MKLTLLLLNVLKSKEGWPNGVDLITQSKDGSLCYGGKGMKAEDIFHDYTDGQWSLRKTPTAYDPQWLSSQRIASTAEDYRTAVVTKQDFFDMIDVIESAKQEPLIAGKFEPGQTVYDKDGCKCTVLSEQHVRVLMNGLCVFRRPEDLKTGDEYRELKAKEAQEAQKDSAIEGVIDTLDLTNVPNRITARKAARAMYEAIKSGTVKI